MAKWLPIVIACANLIRVRSRLVKRSRARTKPFTEWTSANSPDLGLDNNYKGYCTHKNLSIPHPDQAFLGWKPHAVDVAISEKYQFVYLDNVKAASTLIRQVLQNIGVSFNCGPQYQTTGCCHTCTVTSAPCSWNPSRTTTMCLADKHRNYFVFTFVRDPIDKFESGVRQARFQGGEIYQLNDLSSEELLQRQVELYSNSSNWINEHLQPNSYRVFGTIRNGSVVKPHFIGRIEHMGQDWKQLIQQARKKHPAAASAFQTAYSKIAGHKARVSIADAKEKTKLPEAVLHRWFCPSSLYGKDYDIFNYTRGKWGDQCSNAASTRRYTPVDFVTAPTFPAADIQGKTLKIVRRMIEEITINDTYADLLQKVSSRTCYDNIPVLNATLRRERDTAFNGYIGQKGGQSTRFLVYRFWGGWGSSLWGMANTFLWALLTNRTFVVESTAGQYRMSHPLTIAFEPGLVNWTIHLPTSTTASKRYLNLNGGTLPKAVLSHGIIDNHFDHTSVVTIVGSSRGQCSHPFYSKHDTDTSCSPWILSNQHYQHWIARLGLQNLLSPCADQLRRHQEDKEAFRRVALMHKPWHSLLWHLLLRPTPALINATQHLIDRLARSSLSIGMHIRVGGNLGDAKKSCRHKVKGHCVQDYSWFWDCATSWTNSARRQRLGADVVWYVTSDELGVLEEAHEKGNASGVDVLFVAKSSIIHSGKSRLPSSQHLIETFADWWVLAHTHVMLLSPSSYSSSAASFAGVEFAMMLESCPDLSLSPNLNPSPT